MKLRELIENEYSKRKADNKRKVDKEMRDLSSDIKKEESWIKDLKQKLKEFKRKKVYAVEKKYDGFRVTIHKKEDDVKVFDRQANDITSSFSSVVGQIKTLSGKDFIIDAEAVLFKNNKPFGKELIEEYVASAGKSKALEDKDLFLFAFDCPYFEKDITDLSWLERRKVLDSLNFGSRIKKVASVIVQNREDAHKTIDMFNLMQNSGGATVKQVHSKYLVEGKSPDWMDFKVLAKPTVVQEESKVGKSG